MTTISIDFSEHLADGYARNNRRVDVTGTPDEPFAPRAEQELGVHALHFIVVGEYGSVVAAVGDHATFGEVADFAGGLALPLDDARRGGSLFHDLWTLINNGLTLYAIYGMYRDGTRKIEGLKFRKHREELDRWVLGGMSSPPRPELARLIKAEPGWDRKTVEEGLGLSRHEAAELFRHLGYRYGSGWDYWYEDASE